MHEIKERQGSGAKSTEKNVECPKFGSIPDLDKEVDKT